MTINFLAIFLAALAAFFLGYLWYTVLVAKQWQKAIGMKSHGKNDKTPDLGRLLIGSFILELIMAFNLSIFIGTQASWLTGLIAGLVIGAGWVSLAFGVNYLFEGKSLKLWLINAGYNVVTFGAMGAIIGAL